MLLFDELKNFATQPARLPVFTFPRTIWLVEQGRLPTLLNLLLLFALQFLDALFGRGEFFGCRAPQLVEYEISDLAPNGEVGRIGSLFSLDVLSLHRRVRLGCAKDIVSEFF